MLWLKESTQAVIKLGPFVDDTDGKTAETGLTIANTDVRLSKNGGNFAASAEVNAGYTHDELGYYDVTLTSTDLATLGRLIVACQPSGALTVRQEFMVYASEVYDALVSGPTNYLQVNAVQIEGSDATDQINAACDTALTDYDAVVPADLPTNFADLSITATTGRVDVATIEGSDATDQINAACDTAIETYGLDHLVAATVAGTDIADNSIIARIVSSAATADWDTFDNTTDSLQNIRDELVTVDGNVDSILVDTAEIGSAGAGLTAIPWNSSWDAEVQSEVNDGLVAIGLDHLVSASVTGTDITDNSIVAKIVSSSATADWDDFDNTTDSLQNIRDELVVVDGNVDSILVDTAEIGAAGAGLTAVPWNAAWDAEVQSEVDDGLKALNLDHLMAAAVVGTDITDNSVIAKLVSSSATADWDDFDNTTDSLMNIRDELVVVDGNVDSILVDTAEIGAAGAGLTAVPWNAAWDAEVESEVQDVVGAAGASLTAIPWNAAWDAEVQSEVDDGLKALGLDHLLAAAVAGADVTDDSIVAKIVSSAATADWDTFVNTTESLQALRDQGDSAWATATAVDVTSISGDSAAADNLEAMLDGTGGTILTTDITGDITGTIDTVTNVTNAVTITANQDVNVAQISGDSIAADNLEAMLDGTGGTTLTTDITGDITGTIDTVTDVTNMVTANMTQISGDATAANNLEEGATAIVVSAVNDPGGAATTSVFITDLTEATNDHYKGRIVTFTTGNLLGQSSDITAYNGTTKALTVTAMTDTPADNDKFVIT